MDWPQPKDYSLDSPVAAGSQQPVFSRHGPGEGFFLIEEQRSGVCVLLLLKPTLVWDLGGVVAARRRMRPGTAAGQHKEPYPSGTGITRRNESRPSPGSRCLWRRGTPTRAWNDVRCGGGDDRRRQGGLPLVEKPLGDVFSRISVSSGDGMNCCLWHL